MPRNGPAGRKGHIVRRATAIGTVIFALAAIFATRSGAVTAAAGTLGGFENEGNLVVDGAATTDWGSPPAGLQTITDDTTDSGFQGSSKELKPSTWKCNSGGDNPGKGNILRAYLSTAVLDDTQAFLNLAWVRESAEGNGDVHVNYEFNQNGTAGPAPSSGNCPITRALGDLVVTYDFPGGAAAPIINLYRWVPLAVPTAAKDGDWVDQNLTAAAVRAAVNQASQADPVNGGTVEALRFGEATIDLTAALSSAGATECRHFGAAHIRSRSSGESWTSALQDNLPGLPVAIDTCPAAPTLTTTATEQVMEGTAISDVAHLEDGNDPTGTITFKAYGPDDPDCSDAPAFTSSAVAVDGNGDYPSPDFSDPDPGTYRWIASYTSDNLNKNSSVSGVCNAAGETTTVIAAAPKIELDKKVAGGDHPTTGEALLVHAGDEVDYTVDITNAGNVALTISDLEDSLHADLGADCDHGNGFVLGVGETISCSYTDTAASNAHNVASVTGTPEESDPVTASDETFVEVIHPDIALVKDGKTTAHAGDPVTYTFAVTNTGDVALSNVSVDDDILGHIGTITALDAGDTETLEFETVATDDVTNHADACGDDPLELEVCAHDDHSIDVIHPAIAVVKSGAEQAHEGDLVTYTFLVTNTGDVPLTDVSVDDDVLDHIGDIATLEVGFPQTLTKIVSAPALDTRNVATVCGDDPLELEVCNTDDHTIDIIHPGIDVEKSASTDFAHEGDEVTYTFRVHNTGDVALTNVVVTDDVLGSIGTIPTLAAGDTTELTKTMTVPADSTAVDNTVTACGVQPLIEDPLCDTDIHHLPVIHPALEIDKKVQGADHKPASDALLAHQGDDLGYIVVIKNTGDTALEISALTDTLKDGFGADCTQDVGSTLDPDGVITCAYTTTASDDAHNVVSATGVDRLERSLSASDETFVDVIHPAIKIVKTADPKTTEPGGDVTYTYVVTNTGDTTLTDVLVTDDVLGTIGSIDALAAGESKTLTKTVTINAGSPRTNIATACGIDALDLNVCGTAKATISIVLPVPPQERTPQPSLPATGLHVLLWLAFGVNLVAAGLAMMRTQRSLKKA